MNQRRGMFLMLCLFGYLLMMGGWWLSTRNPRQFPKVRIRMGPFVGATPEFTTQLEQSIRGISGVELAKDGALLRGSVAGLQEIRAKAQLEDPRTGEQLWSKDYEATIDHPQAIPLDIAQDAIKVLRSQRPR